MHAHAEDFRSEIPPHEHARADHLLRDWKSAPLTSRELALCNYAAKLAGPPHRVGAADLKPLRDIGLDDAAITDLVQVVAYFSYINRIAEGLGVDLESEMPPKPATGHDEARRST